MNYKKPPIFTTLISKIPILAAFPILVMLLSGCKSTMGNTPGTTPMIVYERQEKPAIQPVTAEHVPVILKVIERSTVTGNISSLYTDITFTDSAGDASAIVDTLVSSGQGSTASDVDIHEPADDQISGTTVTDGLANLRITEAIVEAARTGAVVHTGRATSWSPAFR